MAELQIVYLKPEELRPYENNARKHAPEDVEAIKASIRELGGFNDPIGIWGPDNIIVEGHGRLIAAKEMGLERVPCIRLDHLTDEQRRAYALAHNKTAELSEWDFAGKLEEELAAMEIAGFDMAAFGFDSVSEDGFGEDFDLDSGEKEPFTQMTFTLANEQARRIKEALGMVKGMCMETYGNENSNGNALFEVVRQWLERKT